jgi:predicted nucleotidyltransferase
MKSSSYESILRELVPRKLQERRDYAEWGMDQLEKNALELLDKGIKLPMMLELRLRERLEKAKKASIIDYPKASLCPQMWDLSKQSPVIKTDVRNKILSILRKVLSINFVNYKKWVSEVTLTGSMVTNQYTPETDVDVNVSIDYDVFRECNPDLTRHISNDLDLRNFIRNKVYKLNGEKVAGDHLVKFFVIGKGGRLESDFVFDVLSDKWITSPPILVDKDFDVDDEFAGPRYKAIQIMLSIVPFLLKVKVHLGDLIKLEIAGKDTSKIRQELKNNIDDLNVVCDKLKEIRKVRFEKDHDIDLLGYAFSKNWEYNNIVFKYLEKYGFSKPFKILDVVLTNEEKKRLKGLTNKG